MTTDESGSKTASATVYLMEELGDARMRCDQLVKYVAQAAKLVENSSHRDHFFEVAGHLIQGIPHTLFLLQKALQATALAATRLDYEEIKQDLRPEKVDELERALQDVRVRQVQRRSDPWTPGQAAQAIRGMVAKVRESGHLPKTELMALILGLEFGLKKADATTTAKALEAVAESVETAEAAPSQLLLATLLRQVFADDLLRTTQEHVIMDKTAMDWKTASPGELREMQDILKSNGYNPADAAKLQAEGMGPSELEHRIRTTRPGEMGSLEYTHNLKKVAPGPSSDLMPTSQDMVSAGLEEGLAAMRVAHAAGRQGNYKKMFKNLTGVFSGLAMIGRGFEIQEANLLVRVLKSYARFAGVSPSGVLASEEEKSSKFEEGKPADPTENMSPEDAKKWKTEHDKNKDKFKSAAGKADFDKLQHEMRAHLDTFDMAWSRYEKDPEKNKAKLDDALRYMTALRDVADVIIRNMKGMKEGKTASDDEKKSKFEEGKPADPTENMSPEDAKKWKTEHDKHKDNFKAAGESEEAAKRSRFEKGKPADPTENMDPEDAKRWKEEHDKHKDNFKSARAYAYGR